MENRHLYNRHPTIVARAPSLAKHTTQHKKYPESATFRVSCFDSSRRGSRLAEQEAAAASGKAAFLAPTMPRQDSEHNQDGMHHCNTTADASISGGVSQQPTNILLHRLENVIFVEYLGCNLVEPSKPEFLSAVVITGVEPRDCSRIVKALAQHFPLGACLSHLKRVKRNKKPTTATQQDQEDATGVTAKSSGECHPPVKRSKVTPNEEQSGHIATIKKSNNSNPSGDEIQILLGLAPLSTIFGSENDGSQQEARRGKLAEILLGKEQVLDGGNNEDDIQLLLESRLRTVSVPKHPPQSQAQADQAKTDPLSWPWPTYFYPLKSMEYRRQQLTLGEEEMSLMHQIVQEHLFLDDDTTRQVAVVVDPSTQRVLCKSWEEKALQNQQQEVCISKQNPLATPVLLALQGVARLERQPQQHTSSKQQKQQQYLCTGYDLYCNYEPTIFEAMACVHARLARLIFCRQTNNNSDVWHGALTRHSIHCLPGTNHHYRALEYRDRNVVDGGSRR